MSMTRRSFLGSTALVAGAWTMLSRGACAANERLRVGVVGCRNRGHQVASAMLGAGDFDIAALCDVDDMMAAKARHELGDRIGAGVPHVKDFRRLLDNPEIDIILNATPDHWHAAITLLALDAGKHVYLEKPATYDIAEARGLVAAQAEHPNCFIQVGTQQRSGEHFRAAKQFIDEGGLGKIGFARAWITHQREVLMPVPDSEPPASLDYDLWVGPAPFHPYNENRCHYNWHWVRDYGTGEMGNWGAHWLDIVQWFLGLDLPQATLATGGSFVQRDIKEFPDTQTVLYEYPELTVLWEQRLWTGYRTNEQGSGAEFQGEKGAIVITRSGWTFYPKDGRRERHEGSELEIAHARNFAQAIRHQDRSQLAAPIEEGALSATLCHLGNLAVEHRARLVIDPQTGRFVDHEAASAQIGRAYRSPWESLSRA